MGIPPIAPYVPPREDELPANRVSWSVDPDRAVLLVHDMQRYFVGAYPQDDAPMTLVVPRIAALAADCRAAGVPVVYTAQPPDQDPADRALLTDFWGPGLGTDPSDHRVIDPLTPAAGDVLLTKWRYSAFQRTDLRERMRAWGRDQLVITGIYAHIGCLVTACDAFMQDVQAFLVAGATADFSAQDHRRALRWAADRCSMVVPADAVARRLAPARVGV